MSSPKQPTAPELPDAEENLDLPVQHTPEYHMSDEEVEELEIEYSVRGSNDWVISGPLGSHGLGPGRRFMSMAAARRWVEEKHPGRIRHDIPEARLSGGNRWAFLLRGD